MTHTPPKLNLFLRVSEFLDLMNGRTASDPSAEQEMREILTRLIQLDVAVWLMNPENVPVDRVFYLDGSLTRAEDFL